MATCKSDQIGVRMKAAREALGLTQDGLAQAVGGSKRGIQDNEARNRVPGGEVICGLVSLGINANWLLTGEGPMLLADLAPKPAPAPVPLKINAEYLAAAIDAMHKLKKPTDTPEALSSKAARFYAYLVEQELITETGIGSGKLDTAA